MRPIGVGGLPFWVRERRARDLASRERWGRIAFEVALRRHICHDWPYSVGLSVLQLRRLPHAEGRGGQAHGQALQAAQLALLVSHIFSASPSVQPKNILRNLHGGYLFSLTRLHTYRPTQL